MLDSVPYVYYDKDLLVGFLPDCILPYVDDSCPNRSVGEEDVTEICGSQKADLDTVLVTTIAADPISMRIFPLLLE